MSFFPLVDRGQIEVQRAPWEGGGRSLLGGRTRRSVTTGWRVVGQR